MQSLDWNNPKETEEQGAHGKAVYKKLCRAGMKKDIDAAAIRLRELLDAAEAKAGGDYGSPEF